MDEGLYRFASSSRNYLVYVFRVGTKYISFVSFDTVPLSVRRIPIAEGKYLTKVSCTDSKNKILKVGARLGITKGARDVLSPTADHQAGSDERNEGRVDTGDRHDTDGA